MKKKEKKVESLASMRRKLFSAVAMLLVSSIMMVSSSYAWLVLSTAPEITGISTQVGANGSLEIVLLDTTTYNDLTLVTEADIDESAPPTAQSSNLSWGNLVNLGSAEYGLSNIVLNPSRLFIEKDGDGHKISPVLLKTPIYGEDGRITGLDKTSAVASVFDGSAFPAEQGTYGVRAIGVAANMSTAQLGINAARAALVTNMAAARTAASNILNQQGTALGNIAVGVALKGTETFTTADVTAMKTLAVGLQDSLEYIDAAIRQVYVAYISTIEVPDLEAAKETILDTKTSLSALETEYKVGTEDYPIGTYITTLEESQNDVQGAINGCQELIDKGENVDQSAILGVMGPLVEYEKMTLGGKSLNEVKEMVSGGDLSAVVGLLGSGGLTLSVPSGSGILSDIADFAGNYTATVTVENISYSGFTMEKLDATMATATTVNPVYLTQCSNLMRTFNVNAEGGAATGGSVITDYYGYALDMAFRTNAVESNLLLQTDSAQRIYADSENAATQGGGSYMEFSSNAGLSATKMIKLMKSLRVVFMDKEQNVLSIAALDTTLGKDDYKPLEDDAQEATGKYAVLKGANPAQNSDYITLTEYEALPEGTGNVIFGADGKIKALLHLYDYHMTISTAGNTTPDVETIADGEAGTTEVKYTGGLTLDNKKANSAIVEMQQDVPQQITALVYMDGSFVNNSMVAANSAYSITGVLNLQFASDGNLNPMHNQKLYDGNGAAEGGTTQPPETGGEIVEDGDEAGGEVVEDNGETGT